MNYEIDTQELNKGLNELSKRLGNAVKEKVIKDSLHSGGVLLAGWSARNRLSGPRPQYLGVRTGRLRGSVLSITAGTPAVKEGNAYIQKIGTNVEYGPVHEFGSARVRARPFLRPSIEDTNNRKEILNIFVENINKALNEK